MSRPKYLLPSLLIISISPDSLSRPTSINIIVKKVMKPLSFSLLFALLANLVNANTSLRGNNSIDHQVQEANRFLLKNPVALYLLAEREYEGHDVSRKLQGNPSERMDYVQFADGTTYQVKNAPPGWQVGLASGKDLIKIPYGAVISSGGSIDMRGEKPDVTNGVFGRNLQGDDAKRNAEQESNFAAFRSGRKLQTGVRTVLAVRIILNDGSYTWATQTGLSDDIFGNGVDQHNLKSQYAACSNNQLTFNKSPDRALTGTPTFPLATTAISNGVVDIKVNLAKSAGDGSVVNAVTTEINKVFGVTSPNSLANHVMYCLPSGVMSGIAYAYVGSWNSVYSNEWCNYLSAQMHEVSVVLSIVFVQPIFNKIILTTSRFRLSTKHRLAITLITPTLTSLGPTTIKLARWAVVTPRMMVLSCVSTAPNHGRLAGTTPNVPSSLRPRVVVSREIYTVLPTLAMLHRQLCSSRSTTRLHQTQTSTSHSTAKLESIRKPRRPGTKSRSPDRQEGAQPMPSRN